MKQFYSLLFLLFWGTLSGFSQTKNPGCDGVRYKQPLFQTVKKTTLAYAVAIGHTGQPVNLAMDVYEPEGDTTSQRPVIVLEHGGSFIFGNKADMTRWCELLAKRGYVAASIQYRLYPVFVLGFPDSVDIMDTAVKAVGDMKAAVRFFRQDAATANLFRADPNHIFVGGYSAGAVAALHAAFLDSSDVLPPFMQTILTTNGGLNGNTGNPNNQSFSSKIEAVVNLSGGLYRREWITEGEVPVSSIHGTNDATVPFLSGLAANIAYLEGSGLLHAHAQSIGNWSYLKKVPGAGHTDLYDLAQYAPQVNNFWTRTTSLLEFLTCYVDTMPELTTGIPQLAPQTQPAWSLYPNPARRGQDVSIRMEHPAEANSSRTFAVYDLQGREMLRAGWLNSNYASLPTGQLPSGIYLVRRIMADSEKTSTEELRQLIIIGQ